MDTQTLTVRYSVRMQHIQFLFGTLWMLYGGISLYISEGWKWHYFGFCVLALIYIGAGLWYRYQPYLRLYPDGVEEIRLRSRTLPFDRITEAKTFAGDLILRTSDRTMRLNLKSMRDTDRELLVQQLSERIPQAQFAV